MAVFDPLTGDTRQAHIFVSALGASNFTYAEARWSEGLPDWIGVHVGALAAIGGVPKAVVCDNLKAGVTKASRYEPRRQSFLRPEQAIPVDRCGHQSPLSNSAVTSHARYSAGCNPARRIGSSFWPMRQLFAVPWLSSGGRIVLSILCVAILVCGAFAFVKLSGNRKQGQAQGLVTGSIQRAPTRRPDPMSTLLLAPAVAQPVQRSMKTTTIDPIPLPRPRPKRL